MQVFPQAVCSCNITQPQQAENGEDSCGSLIKLCLLLSWWKAAAISDEEDQSPTLLPKTFHDLHRGKTGANMRFAGQPLGSVNKNTSLKALCLWLMATPTVFLPSA